MKTGKIAVQLAAAILMLGLLGLTTRAQANHDIIDCAALQGLHDATGWLEFTKPDDLVNLQGKVTEAMEKTAEGKTCDATQKLRDYETKLENLLYARKPKVSAPHDGTLECIATALEIHIDDTCAEAGPPPRGKGPK